MSEDNKMLEAYRHLLETAKEAAFKAEQATWETLGKAIDQAEQTVAALAALTDQEIQQVQQDLKADLTQVAVVLDDFEEDASAFAQMEWHALENYLTQKTAEMADPTEMMILRMRLMAALNHADHPNQ